MTDHGPDGGAQSHTARGTEGQAKQTRGKRIIRGFMELGAMLGVASVVYLIIRTLAESVGAPSISAPAAILLGWWAARLYLFGGKGGKDA